MKTLADLQAPRIVAPRRLLEKDVQKQCVDWMRARGYWARKFSSQSQRSVPDYLFRNELFAGEKWHTVGFFCEFKRPGAPKNYIATYDISVMSTEAQYEEQNAMMAVGWPGFECDDFEVFKAWVVAHEKDMCS